MWTTDLKNPVIGYAFPMEIHARANFRPRGRPNGGCSLFGMAANFVDLAFCLSKHGRYQDSIILNLIFENLPKFLAGQLFIKTFLV